MPISDAQRLTLYSLARDHWLEAHSTLSAYNRDYKKSKAVSEWLRHGTLASAVVTAASTATPWPPFTVVSGLLTAALTAVETAYAPAKSSKEFWDCKSQLEAIKRDIVACAIAMEGATDLPTGVEPLNQIGKRLTEGMKVPFNISPTDRQSAEQAFKASVLAGLISRYDDSPDEDEGTPEALGFDAPDVVAVARQSVSVGAQ